MVDAGVAGTGNAVVPGAGSALDLTRGAGVDLRNGCGWLIAILKKSQYLYFSTPLEIYRIFCIAGSVFLQHLQHHIVLANKL